MEVTAPQPGLCGQVFELVKVLLNAYILHIRSLLKFDVWVRITAESKTVTNFKEIQQKRKDMKQLMMAALIAGLMTLGSGSANADLLASDDFSYADGSLVGNGGWTNHSGNAGDLLVSGGQAVVQHGVPSEDAGITFADVNSGILSAVFDIIVNDDTAIGGNDFEYFAHFQTEGSNNFRSRLDVQSGTMGGDYTLGISSTTSTAEATLTQDFMFGDTVSVVLDFDLDTGLGSLTVGSETIVGTSTDIGATLNRFSLRQSDSSNNETVLVDNLRINGTPVIPEPGSMGIIGLAGLIALVRRRK